ncbi:MAG: polysaccharide pyruvyl transferase CsaB [Oscillospiraceae bacterium]
MAGNERINKNKRHGVLICGSYGHGNAGDEAILEAIVESFRTAAPGLPITVMSRRPKETAKLRGVKAIYKFNPVAMLREMLSARLYLNGGGSLIQDVTSSRSLYYYLFTIMAAKILGCRVIMYGCGIGPVRRPQNRRIARDIIDRFADTITLREDDSLRELINFGIHRPKMLVTSDPALALPPAPNAEVDTCMDTLGLDLRGEYLCIVPRKWQGFEKKARDFAECADSIAQKFGLETVFLSIDHKNDALAAELIAVHMKSPYHIIRDVLPSRLNIGILARMRAVISMRLHGLIFAAGQGVPLVGVSYDPKVTAFLRCIGQDNFAELSELTSKSLITMTENALAMPRNQLEVQVRRLRDLESMNLQSALDLLKIEREC